MLPGTSGSLTSSCSPPSSVESWLQPWQHSWQQSNTVAQTHSSTRGLPSRVAFFQVVLTEPRLRKLLPGQPPPHPLGSGLRTWPRGSPPLAADWTSSPPPTTAPPSPGTSPCHHQWRSDSGSQGSLPPSCGSNADAAKFSDEGAFASAGRLWKRIRVHNRNESRIVGETGPVF